jgi:hypothetical protein
MSACDIAAHEVDGKRMQVAFDDDAGPPPSDAYRTAEALLGIYLSRFDFLKHCAVDSRGQSRLSGLGQGPVLNACGPLAIH